MIGVCPICAQAGLRRELKFYGIERHCTAINIHHENGVPHLHDPSDRQLALRCPERHVVLLATSTIRCWCGWPDGEKPNYFTFKATHGGV